MRRVRRHNRPLPLLSVRQGLTAGALILIAFWLVTLIWGLAGKAVFAWKTAHDTQAQAAALQARKSALEKSIQALKTPRGKSAAIRTAFGVARPGEQVIIVVQQKPATTTPPHKAWWQRALGWVGL